MTKGKGLVLFLAVLLWLAAGPAVAEEGLHAVDAAWKAAMEAGNADAVAALYAEDAVTFMPDGEAHGRAAIREAFAGMLSQFDVEATLDTHAETVGDVSYGWTMWSLKVTPKAGGEAMTWKGRATAVARKIDGRWLYVIDHASMPMPGSGEGG